MVITRRVLEYKIECDKSNLKYVRTNMSASKDFEKFDEIYADVFKLLDEKVIILKNDGEIIRISKKN